MKKIILTLVWVFAIGLSAKAQIVTTDPLFPTADDEITFTYDATQGVSDLPGASKVYMHSGLIIDGNTDLNRWDNVVGNWGQDDGVGQMTSIGDDKWQIIFTPRDYYAARGGDDIDISNANIDKLGMVFRNEAEVAGRGPGGSNIFIEIYQPGEFDARLETPFAESLIVEENDVIPVIGVSSINSNLKVAVDGVVVEEVPSGTGINFDFTVGTNLAYEIVFTAELAGQETISQTVQLVRRIPSPVAALPAGIEDGINYINDNTVTFSLLAPGKEFAYLIGDLTDWKVDPDFLMNVTPDGQRLWYTIDNLTPGEEYLFQYLVDGSIRIADPYSDLVVDEDDRFINFLSDEVTPYTVYENLIPYPFGKTTGIISVVQTAQPEFNWQNDDYDRPDKEDLIIYELLIRDFVAQHDYKTVMDSLDYLQRMGINAIELLPIMEFENNNSWGYNPSFHLAVDKYYGTRNDLKRFIDECHARGIAVILDMVLNHAFGESPLVELYRDGDRATPESPWFNEVSPHPFNVGFDFNQETEATQYFVDRVNRYWIEEYHFDGYRFDLIKGFTQNREGRTDDNFEFDQSRIDIVNRMVDEIWDFDPEAYIILEGFIDNSEENIYQERGMMPWGSEHFTFEDAMLGQTSGGDFQGLYAASRGRPNDYMVGFFESHDEARMPFKAVTEGRVGNDYNIQDTLIALERVKLLSAFAYLVPGPKMFWMFGELGYDYDIDFNGRTGRKPIRWDYYEDPDRLRLYKAYSAILNLRRANEDIIAEADFEWQTTGTTRRLAITHPDLNVLVIGNFATGTRAIDPEFQKAGTWYDFFTGKPVNITNPREFYELAPGEFHIFTDVQQEVPEEGLVPFDVETITGIPTQLADGTVSVFPNPTSEGKLRIRQSQSEQLAVEVLNMVGEQLDAFQIRPDGRNTDYEYDMSQLEKGVYLLRIRQGTDTFTAKIINQ